ncbi:MAG: 4-hydroxybenzoate octaprenyltransferase [bacterium]
MPQPATSPPSRIRACISLMRLDRPIGALLLLWPTLWALWLAGDGRPDAFVVAVFVAGVMVMRAAGCVINDCADRNIDGAVERTRARPLASGALQLRHAIALLIALLVLALALVLQLNTQAQVLSLFALGVAALYPFAKRFTHLAQAVLGVAFSWGIPMAYAALRGAVPAEAWLLFFANFAWTIAYDTQYAMVDRDDDLRIGVKSTAILLGARDNLAVGALHLCCLGALTIIGWQRDLPPPFHLGLAAALALAAYQQYLCRNRDRDGCFRAFLNNNWFGATIFVALVMALDGGVV